MPSRIVEPPMPDATSMASSEDAEVAEVESGLNRQEEESSDASPTLAAKDVTEANYGSAYRGVLIWLLLAHQVALRVAVTAESKAEAESSRSYAQNLAEEKIALLVKVEQERVDAAEYKASCHWAVKYLEGGKNNHFAGLDDFRTPSGGAVWRRRRRSYAKLRVRQSLGNVVSVPWLDGKAVSGGGTARKKAADSLLAGSVTWEYLHMWIMAGLTLARHATEGAEAQPDYFLKPDVSQLQVPIFASPRDILNPFALEKESH
ncbi:hypothetical protein Tco_0059198 [Tanacetum coccineum]